MISPCPLGAGRPYTGNPLCLKATKNAATCQECKVGATPRWLLHWEERILLFQILVCIALGRLLRPLVVISNARILCSFLLRLRCLCLRSFPQCSLLKLFCHLCLRLGPSGRGGGRGDKRV